MSQGSNLTTWQLDNLENYWFPAPVWLSDIFSWEPALETANSRDAAAAAVPKKALTTADEGDLLVAPVERLNELRPYYGDNHL